MRQVYNLAELSLGLGTLPPGGNICTTFNPQDFSVEVQDQIEIMTSVKPLQVLRCFPQPLSRGHSPPDPAVEEDDMGDDDDGSEHYDDNDDGTFRYDYDDKIMIMKE